MGEPSEIHQPGIPKWRHRTAKQPRFSRNFKVQTPRPDLPAMVLGVRVHGPDVVDVEVKLDETFRSVPVPEKLGIPVLYKTQSGTGGAARSAVQI